MSGSEKHIFGVAEVNQFIKTMLDGVPALQDLYVRGELSNYKIYPSGHHYFTLKDPEGVLRCVMFRSSAAHLRFRPENGMKVIVRGRITAFVRDGQYQLYCDAVTPEGAGDLAVAFEQLKARLYQEGLFDASHKKPLPPFPQRIAIITSGSGAAVHDMLRILRRRYPICKVIVLPVRVQGVEAAPEIVGAIRYANRWRVADLIITGRGGGSMEDLWAFNDERVARAIYESELPVISAVGHEPDVTISDFVADVRASTPSNAAEIAVPDAVELAAQLSGARAHMLQVLRQSLQLLRQTLQTFSESRILRNPAAAVQDKRMELDLLHRKLTGLAQADLARRRQQFAALAASLDALSPLKVLGRGYSVAKDTTGQLLRSIEQTEVGQAITVTLGDGSLDCTVYGIRKGEKA
ncbi:MAG: exodeoxyribonuclease VII large subunit [Clostridiales bacterium]|nr:exodeoxyribonuclease VII large subunit [Clostridiales bacterium]